MGTRHKRLCEDFWDVISEMVVEERAKVLAFTCGSSRLPATGFSELKPAFTVQVVSAPVDHLPHAHTCANELCIPPYHSRGDLEEKLRRAVDLDSGFGFM